MEGPAGAALGQQAALVGVLQQPRHEGREVLQLQAGRRVARYGREVLGGGGRGRRGRARGFGRWRLQLVGGERSEQGGKMYKVRMRRPGLCSATAFCSATTAAKQQVAVVMGDECVRAMVRRPAQAGGCKGAAHGSGLAGGLQGCSIGPGGCRAQLVHLAVHPPAP